MRCKDGGGPTNGGQTAEAPPRPSPPATASVHSRARDVPDVSARRRRRGTRKRKMAGAGVSPATHPPTIRERSPSPPLLPAHGWTPIPALNQPLPQRERPAPNYKRSCRPSQRVAGQPASPRPRRTMDAAGAAEGGGDEASVAQLRTFIRLRPVPEARPTVVARTDRRVLLLRVSPWGCRPPPSPAPFAAATTPRAAGGAADRAHPRPRTPSAGPARRRPGLGVPVRPGAGRPGDAGGRVQGGVRAAGGQALPGVQRQHPGLRPDGVEEDVQVSAPDPAAATGGPADLKRTADRKPTRAASSGRRRASTSSAGSHRG